MMLPWLGFFLRTTSMRYALDKIRESDFFLVSEGLGMFQVQQTLTNLLVPCTLSAFQFGGVLL